MTKKFNPKLYQGKARVYPPVPGAQGIRRLYVWDEARGEYVSPERGKPYEARRYELAHDGKRVRIKRSFDSLEEARQWMARLEPAQQPVIPANVDTGPVGPTLSEVVAEWRNRIFPTLAESTRIAYDKIVRLYFGPLSGLPIEQITPKQVDVWIEGLKDPKGWAMQSKRRLSFDHELELLRGILRYYIEYNDDSGYRCPIKERHREAVKLNRSKPPKARDLTAAEFFRFRDELKTLKHGETLAAMATVQFFQALRVSEVAGLYWEDLYFDDVDPTRSRVKVVRHVCWPRKKGSPSSVQTGFKNAGANHGVKEQPMFPEAFMALIPLRRDGASGLIFAQDGGHFEYRQIQYAYDTAFKRAGLPYTATHVMRHGGCRRVYNEVPDVEVAKQLLGNSSPQSAWVYAKRDAGALTKVAKDEWARVLAELGRNGSQIAKVG